jgi:hypothetical protein
MFSRFLVFTRDDTDGTLSLCDVLEWPRGGVFGKEAFKIARRADRVAAIELAEYDPQTRQMRIVRHINIAELRA